MHEPFLEHFKTSRERNNSATCFGSAASGVSACVPASRHSRSPCRHLTCFRKDSHSHYVDVQCSRLTGASGNGRRVTSTAGSSA